MQGSRGGGDTTACLEDCESLTKEVCLNAQELAKEELVDF